MEPEKLELQTGSLLVRKPGGWGVRHTFAVLGFWSFAMSYAMRFNLSLAIVAMVNTTNNAASKGGANLGKVDGCPHLNPLNFVNESFSEGGPIKIPIHDSTKSQGEFNWDPADQGLILGAFFWGYIVMQLPGGLLAKHFGGKWPLGIGLMITGVFTLLTPLAARTSTGALIFVRAVQGLGEGVGFPAMHTMLASWAPPSERSQLGSIIYAGAQFGTAMTMVVGGYLIDGGVMGGWPSIFYTTGAITLIWFVLWSVMVSDTPAEHPKISIGELTYIESALGSRPSQSKMKVQVPWKSILSSKPVWAIIVSCFGHAWGLYTLLALMPTFLKTVLHFDIKNNSWLSAMPHLLMWVVGIVLAQIADHIISRKLLSLATVRKLFTAIAHIGSALALIGASYSGCNATTTVALLTLAVGIEGSVYGGIMVNHIDISPQHAGVIFGFSNTIVNFSGFLAPYVAGLLIKKDPSLQNWQYVFFIAAAMYIADVIFYIIFGEAEEQSWSIRKNVELSVVPQDDDETKEKDSISNAQKI